eukprot:TRINITY_DN72223_c0_g1_i1.p2 TRINITY_DN72223_c0_g1~~TRINITY_DN72223_c0_g1_i1.p2  ORF type:complete len:168 (+),score=26.47 TRINITY_DN72223_c0_g1_i1:873-1376(+)
MGLSKQDVSDIIGNWTLAMKAAQQAVLDNNGFTWRMFSPGSNTGGMNFLKSECVEKLRTHCVQNDTLQHSAMMMNAGSSGSFEQSLAAFLLLRGPYAWFGSAWHGCGIAPPQRPPSVDDDYGEPVGPCAVVAAGSGIFKRAWTKMVVTLDCQKWEGRIEPKSADLVV